MLYLTLLSQRRKIAWTLAKASKPSIPFDKAPAMGENLARYPALPTVTGSGNTQGVQNRAKSRLRETGRWAAEENIIELISNGYFFFFLKTEGF